MSSHDAFDDFARSVHAQSLQNLSPRVQSQLALRRRGALDATRARRSRGVLRWAGVATAGLALALAIQLRPTAPAGSGPDIGTGPQLASTGGGASRSLAAVDVDASAADLTEDPEFYLWLGATRLADAE